MLDAQHAWPRRLLVGGGLFCIWMHGWIRLGRRDKCKYKCVSESVRGKARHQPRKPGHCGGSGSDQGCTDGGGPSAATWNSSRVRHCRRRARHFHRVWVRCHLSTDELHCSGTSGVGAGALQPIAVWLPLSTAHAGVERCLRSYVTCRARVDSGFARVGRRSHRFSEGRRCELARTVALGWTAVILHVQPRAAE